MQKWWSDGLNHRIIDTIIFIWTTSKNLATKHRTLSQNSKCCIHCRKLSMPWSGHMLHWCKNSKRTLEKDKWKEAYLGMPIFINALRKLMRKSNSEIGRRVAPFLPVISGTGCLRSKNRVCIKSFLVQFEFQAYLMWIFHFFRTYGLLCLICMFIDYIMISVCAYTHVTMTALYIIPQLFMYIYI